MLTTEAEAKTETTLVRPWEKVGISVPIEGRLRTGEALRLTGNDWKVEKVRITTSPNIVYLKDEEGEFLLDDEGNKTKDEAASEDSDLFGINNPQMCMTIRSDTRSYLGTVGKNYKVIQNTEYAEFFDEALGEDAACISAVGTLGRYGAQVFMVATLPDMLEILPDEPIERHILLTNTHDGTSPIQALFVAWDQTRNLMVHAPGNAVKIRHTKNAKKRIKTAHEVLHANKQYWERAQRAFAYMAKTSADEATIREFLAAMFPDIQKKEDGKVVLDAIGEPVMHTSPQAQTKRDEIRGIFEDAEQALPQTKWGLYNSVAVFVDHKRRVAKSHKDTGVSQWEISVFGPGAVTRDKAFRLLSQQ